VKLEPNDLIQNRIGAYIYRYTGGNERGQLFRSPFCQQNGLGGEPAREQPTDKMLPFRDKPPTFARQFAILHLTVSIQSRILEIVNMDNLYNKTLIL
jgi:hypothetical protein